MRSLTLWIITPTVQNTIDFRNFSRFAPLPLSLAFTTMPPAVDASVLEMIFEYLESCGYVESRWTLEKESGMTPIAGSTDGSRGVDFHGWWSGMNLMLLHDYELKLSFIFFIDLFLDYSFTYCSLYYGWNKFWWLLTWWLFFIIIAKSCFSIITSFR